MPRTPEKITVSQVIVSQLNRQIGKELGSRTTQSIQAGMFTLYIFFFRLGIIFFIMSMHWGDVFVSINFKLS